MTKLMKMTEKFNVIAMVRVLSFRTPSSLAFMLTGMTFKDLAPRKRQSTF